ncbi:MAG: AAA family ATPase [Candidatus Neomarinimicrobiota bacterium]
MNLFDSIGLKSDPFSTSPNVDLFYPAAQHRQCLEGLELAIRMRRGLSVVRGGIGVGKTTVSRKLIQNFKMESDDFDFYLILDPKFESEIILLQHIIELFGVDETGNSVQACRNIIENFLLKVGVDQGKVLVLIIDEGQNLPGEMLDVFRTLLNFETDDFKLLQLIIFGQPEMGNMIHKYPNFEDRISFDFEIGPTAIEDMRGMIDHRIEVCGGSAGAWFTEEAILKIHKNTQGYPRKVTQLCHQALLTMMSENKNEITEKMIQGVISGTGNTTGLLKQKKKNYNEIAVNKLLDVLRKDEGKSKKIEFEDIDDEDDWIGGEKPKTEESSIKPEPVVQTPIVEDPIKPEPVVQAPIVEDPIKPEPVVQAPIVEDPIKPEPVVQAPIVEDLIKPEPVAQTPIVENPIKPAPVVQKPIIQRELEKVDNISNPGMTPPHAKVKKIPLDNIYIGITFDRGRLCSVIIEEKKGVKTLLAHHIQCSKLRNLDAEKDSVDFTNECKNLLSGLMNNISERSEIYKSAFKTLEQKKSIYININNENLMLKLLKVSKENQKDKEQIIEWGMKKQLPQLAEDLLINSSNGSDNNYNIGVGKKSQIENTNNLFSSLEWEVRGWAPTSQSIFNVFYWNYPELLNKTVLLINIGEKNSTIIGTLEGKIKSVEELRIGVQSLNEALMDQGIIRAEWYNREEFQVPGSFISAIGKKVQKGVYDEIFTPVFESWQQDLSRTINSVRKDFPFTNETDILLSGSASDILYLDNFIEGVLSLKTQYISPTRNLDFAQNYIKRGHFPFHSSLLASAIGSTINVPNSADIMPQSLKQNEIFRWINRIGSLAAILILVLLLGMTSVTKLNKDKIQSEIIPIDRENNELSFAKEEHDRLISNTNSISSQLSTLNYDTKYFNRVLMISRFLSFHTPKEINISEVNFTLGWEELVRRKKGRIFKNIIKKSDDNVRILRLAGNAKANQAIVQRHFDNYVSALEASGLFQFVEVMEEEITDVDNGKLNFILKCVI